MLDCYNPARRGAIFKRHTATSAQLNWRAAQGPSGERAGERADPGASRRRRTGRPARGARRAGNACADGVWQLRVRRRGRQAERPHGPGQSQEPPAVAGRLADDSEGGPGRVPLVGPAPAARPTQEWGRPGPSLGLARTARGRRMGGGMAWRNPSRCRPSERHPPRFSASPGPVVTRKRLGGSTKFMSMGVV